MRDAPARARIAPRLLTAEEAAAYLGYATTALLKNVPVQPVKLTETGPGCAPKYDRKALDAWLDRLSGLTPDVPAGAEAQGDAEAAFAGWKARRGGA